MSFMQSVALQKQMLQVLFYSFLMNLRSAGSVFYLICRVLSACFFKFASFVSRKKYAKNT